MFLTILYVIEVISAFLLIIVILAQPSKGGGLGGGFGAAMGESVFGSQASRTLIKFTIWLGCIFVATTLMIAKYSGPGGAGKARTGAPTAPAVPQVPAGQGSGVTPGSTAPAADGAATLGASPVLDESLLSSPVVPASAGDTPQN